MNLNYDLIDRFQPQPGRRKQTEGFMDEQAPLGAAEICNQLVLLRSERKALYDTLRALVLRLARGTPIGPEEMAVLLHCDDSDVEHRLWTLPLTVERDEHGRIVGAGLTLRPTRHEFTMGGKRLYTWCALDALLFPIWLGRTAHIRSPCIPTGRTVSLTVGPHGLDAVAPAEAVVSLVAPDRASTDIRRSFCVHVNFFSSPEAARLSTHQGRRAVTLGIHDAFALAKRLEQSTARTPCPC